MQENNRESNVSEEKSNMQTKVQLYKDIVNQSTMYEKKDCGRLTTKKTFTRPVDRKRKYFSGLPYFFQIRLSKFFFDSLIFSFELFIKLISFASPTYFLYKE